MEKKSRIILACLLVVLVGVSLNPSPLQAAAQKVLLDNATTKTKKVLLITEKAKEVDVEGEKVFVMLLPDEEKEKQAALRVKNILRITGKLKSLKDGASLNGNCPLAV